MARAREDASVREVELRAVVLAPPLLVRDVLRQGGEVVRAVAPFERAFGEPRPARGEHVADRGGHGVDDGRAAVVLHGLDAARQAELQELVRGVEDVRAPVAERAGAVFVEATPVAVDEVVVVGAERTLREPHAPVHLRRLGLLARHLRQRALPLEPAPVVRAHEGVDLRHVLDRARLHKRLHLPVVRVRVALVAHLRNDLVPLRGGGHQGDLAEAVAHRLLAVHGLAHRHREHRGGEVREVGRRHAHGVDLRGVLVEHLAEVLVARRVRIFLQDVLRVGRAHLRVAEGDHVHEVLVVREHGEVVRGLVADAHERHVHLAVRRGGRRAQVRKRARRHGAAEKVSSLKSHGVIIPHFPRAGGAGRRARPRSTPPPPRD